MAIEFKPCGDCTACCSGALAGNIYGNKFNKDKPCVFLVDSKCSIYDTRPDGCRNYQCGWSQGLFPDWLTPTACYAIISVENTNTKQFLKVVPLTDNLNSEIEPFLDEWTKENNTTYTVVGKNED